MFRDYLGRETAARLDIDYQNTENLGEIKHKYSKPGPRDRALTVENDFSWCFDV